MLARNPADSSARAGLAEVHERLLARAENALLEERLDEAAAAIETARKSGIEGGRIAFLTAQLAKSRETDQKRRRRKFSSSPAPAPTAKHGGAGREARAGLRPARGSAQRHRSAGIAHAAALIDSANGIAVAANIESVPRLARRARKQADVDAWGQLLKNANERLLQDRLIEPANDNAKIFYLTLKQLDRAMPRSVRFCRILERVWRGKARRALILGQVDAAKSWLDEAGAIGFTSAEVSSAQHDLDVGSRQTELS